jgi:hypothetical protein
MSVLNLLYSLWRVEPGPLSLLAEVSAWSGPYTWISVGIPEQQLKVSLDFESSGNIFWRPQLCPAFLAGGCYNATASSDFSTVGTWPGNEPLIGLDRFLIGSKKLSQAMVRVLDPMLEGHDVAGAVDLGPRSVVMKDRILSVRQRITGGKQLIEFSEIQRENISPDISFLACAPSKSGWVFGARVGDFQLSLQIDMKHGGLRMSRAVFDAIARVDWIVDDSSGKITAACDHSNGVGLVLDLNSGLRVALGMKPADHLSGRCDTGIVIDNKQTHVLVGHVILSAVEEILFDYKEKRIGFYSHKDYIPSIFIPARSHLDFPLFAEPEITGNMVVFRPGTEMFLRSFSTSHVHLSIFGPYGAECWSFHRIKKKSNAGIPIEPLPHVGSSVSIRFDSREDSVVIDLRPSRIGRSILGVIVRSSVNIHVCHLKYVEAEDLIIPESGIAGSNTDCVFCLDEIIEGDFAQGLAHCDHVFHTTCFDDWIAAGGGENGCPTCRRAIDKITRPNSTG